MLEDCQKLLDRFNYPWEMMPLVYAILKDAQGNLESAAKRIAEGQATDILLDLCHRLREKFQFPWRMISLVDVILKYPKKNQDEAWRQIEEAYLESRALHAVHAARYYHRFPHLGLYSNTALYPPAYLPTFYHHAPTTLLASVPICSSPSSHSPPTVSTPPMPGSRT